MPTYEYQCKNCEHRFEIWQKMTDDALTVCPQCQGVLRRLLFPAGIVFKGSGFYKTDHGNGQVASDNHANNNQTDGTGESKDQAAKTESTAENNTSGEKTEKASSTKAEKVSTPASESKATAAAD